MNKKYTIFDLTELKALATLLVNDFLSKIKTSDQATVVALSGDLGAGKTALVKLVAKELGIFETITSPTFNIIKLYQITGHEKFKQLVHIDAYRIDDISELRPLRFAEFLNDKNNLVCIEWPEKIKAVLPADTINISIKILPAEEREITFN